MDTTPSAVTIPTPTPTTPEGATTSPPIGAIPSNTFSVSVVNTILGSYIESAATLEEIANQCSISIPQVLECLREQEAFLKGLLNTLESRVRIIAARVEATAIQTLNDVVIFARDSESRRKAASKLLSHFAHSKPRPSRAPASAPASALASGSTGFQPVASAPASASSSGSTGFQPVPTCST